jgi:hypothetical protein
MPRLYFNIREGDELIEDWEGTEYSSLSEARIAAVKGAREIMASRVVAGKQPNHTTFEIMDDSGRIVLVLPFLDAIEKK